MQQQQRLVNLIGKKQTRRHACPENESKNFKIIETKKELNLTCF